MLTRDTQLDKKELPPVGYYWAPAVADQLVYAQGLRKIQEQPTHPKVKIVDNGQRKFYAMAGLGRKFFMNAAQGFIKDIYPKSEPRMLGQEFLSSCPFVLYNALDGALTKDTKTRKDLVRKSSYTIQDSGGFQLFTGVADFIDPLDLIKRHNTFADVGVSLDLPLSSSVDKDVVLAGARMLASNSTVLKDGAHKHLRLFNVGHGATLALRKAWLDIAMREPLDALCIAGLRATAISSSDAMSDRTTPSAFVSHVLFSMLYTESKYDNYHVLGVATPWQMGLLALIARLHQKVITSDSASHILSGKSGLLLNYSQSNYKLGGRLSQNFGFCACACPMCSYVGHHYWQHSGPSWISAVHNGYALREVAITMNSIADAALAEKWPVHKISKAFIANSYKSNIPPGFINALDRSILTAMNTTKISSLKEVHQRVEKHSLFSTPASSVDRKEVFLKVIRKYEAYFKKRFYKEGEK